MPTDTGPIIDPPRTHNEPPPEMTLVEKLAAGLAQPLARAQGLTATPVGEVRDAADLEDVSALRKDATRMWKELDEYRVNAKRPYDEAAKEVQNFFLPTLAALDRLARQCGDAVTAYQRKVADEQRRVAAEAAQRLRDEEERRKTVADSLLEQGLDSAADGVAETAVELGHQARLLDDQARGGMADLVRTTTGSGTVSAKVELKFQVDDSRALRKTLGKLGDHLAAPDIEKAIRSYMRGEQKAGREPALAGVRFYSESKAIFR